ncbi:hypothetical protein BJ138DRAFT_1103640 [Hygrophoropsis aurantiaca]|uniref:Uncharacterized protein n=1 Tax=Hygrophoropsis aurantiaca TaxID=72124 RepID=A0ACB8A5E9_9AGAM|nr:hypothetical protein BJ138DRAFT_1103640 [Hygrophoropsis aurantiaca]
MAREKTQVSSNTKAHLNRKPEARKLQPKQDVPISERLKRLFASLCAQIDGGHFTNAIKTCNKILRVEPADKDALQTKLFLLLQTEQYETALPLIKHDSDNPENLFERAYALYRLHHEPEADSALSEIKQTEKEHRGVLHLEAQLNYRQASYQTSVDLYSELLETAEPQSEEYSDVLTNLTASQKHLDFINKDFLRALDALPAMIASVLESSPPPAQTSTSVPLAVSAQIEDESAAPKKARKTRTSRVPKGVVPGVTHPPDPERWLKKTERSNYGAGLKKRRGVGGGGGATQGAVADATPAPSRSSGGGQSKGKKKK